MCIVEFGLYNKSNLVDIDSTYTIRILCCNSFDLNQHVSQLQNVKVCI